MGIPTIAGETTFDPCYQGNILCNAMSVGLMDQKDIQQVAGLDLMQKLKAGWHSLASFPVRTEQPLHETFTNQGG